jgi:hypothetical protein
MAPSKLFGKRVKVKKKKKKKKNTNIYCEHELINITSKHMVISETIEPSRYEQLLQYYRQYQYHPANQSTQTVYPTTQLSDLIHTRSVNYALRNDSSVKITIPESFGLESFHGFVDRFGPDIFVLWKAALLRKRIMLINMPPMEVACKYGKELMVHFVAEWTHPVY